MRRWEGAQPTSRRSCDGGSRRCLGCWGRAALSSWDQADPARAHGARWVSHRGADRVPLPFPSCHLLAQCSPSSLPTTSELCKDGDKKTRTGLCLLVVPWFISPRWREATRARKTQGTSLGRSTRAERGLVKPSDPHPAPLQVKLQPRGAAREEGERTTSWRELPR